MTVRNFLLASDLRPFSSRTAMFITHDGTAGIAQLVGVSQSPPSATLRYKLVGRAPSTRP